jgi:putative addiction module killer protein
MIEVVEYQTEDGKRPFDDWFGNLNADAALKVRTALARLENENFSNVKAVGQGVSECKINFGPGYRVYFGMDGKVLLVLLGGGTKKRQNRYIKDAQTYWSHYKERKKRR